MDTRLKNSHKAGAIVVLIILAICSVIMLGQYGRISRSLDAQETASTRTDYALFEIGSDLAEGNYLLYNEYKNETPASDVLEDYGRSEFDLLRKYMDYGLFAPAALGETKEGAGESGSDGGENAADKRDAADAEDMTDGADSADPAETADRSSPRDPTGAADEVLYINGDAASLTDASGDDYAFRAAFEFTNRGEVSDVRVDGSAIEPNEAYDLENNYIDSALLAESSTISDISTPSGVTVIYGMTQDNLDAFAQRTAGDVSDSVDVAYVGAYRDTLEMLALFVIAAALLMPLSRRLDISEWKIFRVPFEIPLLIFFCWSLVIEIIAFIVYRTVNGTLLPGMQYGNGMELTAGVFNLIMWMAVFGVIFWGVTSVRAVFRMGTAYWKERTLTARLIRHIRKRGGINDGAIKERAGGLWKRCKAFIEKQYDALQHIDFTAKTNRTILKIVVINFVVLFIVCLFWWYGTFALLVYSALLFFFLQKYMKDLQEKYKLLLESTNQLAEGHLDVPIEGDIGLFNPIQEELKKIQKGFKKAVEEEVKNERMKTELVTNVSHDLRTPLTAIITYTDLLKNETDEEKRKEYIEVLEKKSLRLKVLIEDLFEISKAASKNVVMHYMKVDIVDLLKQVGLENDGKIRDAHLDFRWKLPEEKVVMSLDSQKTYRIFENLIVNITKYAMPHTRVYVEMTDLGNSVHISMKNISASELNFDVDEITDRFVRGDSSRNTEGSGLGLAIAKSFVELQHGTLKISTEADLFKADITLPKLDIPQEGEKA